MSDLRRLLLVGGSLVCLLVVASTLPAADPRIDVDRERAVEGAEPSTAAAQQTPKPESEGTTRDRDGPDIRISEPAAPGDLTEARLVGVDDPSGAVVTVNGEYEGTTDTDGDERIRVPAAREMTVTADVPGRSENVSRTVDVRTNVTVEVDAPAVPGRSIGVNATIGSLPLSGAAVYVDGEQVETTHSSGQATVPLPETAGPADIRVERGPFEGERTVEVADPQLTFESPFLFPGSFGVVTVTADGAPVANAAVAVNGDQAGTTDGDGETMIQLPLARQARITTELGDETATATAGGLYLRLTAVVVLVPGFVLGSVWTLGRILTMVEQQTPSGERTMERDAQSGGGADLFVLLGGLLGAFADGITGSLAAFAEGLARLGALLRGAGEFGGGSLSWPSISLPSLGALTLSISPPSGSGFSRWFGSGDDVDPDVALDVGDAIDSTSETADGRRAQIRAVWHAFLDRLGVENRETQTAGQVARRAVVRGFRAASVRRLVATFRAVEYGDRDPTPERVAEVRAVTEELLTDDTDDGEGPVSDTDVGDDQ